MKILVTAGNTQAPIDRVRCLTNIFTGRTGARIALHAHDRGHDIILFTSHPEALPEPRAAAPAERWMLRTYCTYGDLALLMADCVPRGGLDAIIHCAAVSDYLPVGIYSPAGHTHFLPEGRWESDTGDPPALVDRAAGKVKSDEPELWLRLLRAPKLIDLIRSDWGFRGVLVKFKLEVGVSDERLLEIAERSRRQSGADLMVANTLEDHDSHAFLGPVNARYEGLGRSALAERLLEELECIHKERRRG
jgi:phosphopantothenoylcysteine synthetase/decarboxylase